MPKTEEPRIPLFALLCLFAEVILPDLFNLSGSTCFISNTRFYLNLIFPSS